MLDLMDEYSGLAGPASVDAPTPGTDGGSRGQAYVVDGDADQTQGAVVVDVAFFDPDYRVARDLALDFDARLMGYPVKVSSNGRTVLFDAVETISIPREVPWLDDNSIRKFLATYRVTFRRR